MDERRRQEVARRAWLQLALVPGIGCQLRERLLERFESPEGVFAASAADLMAVPGIGRQTCRAILRAASGDELDAVLAKCGAHGISVLCPLDLDFPVALGEIPDPPPILFVRGQLLAQDGLAVAVVGTRHASAYGRIQARRISAQLTLAGMTIVSGLARGIDGTAHRAALDENGRTIAVLAGSLLAPYPPEHRELAEAIAERGAVISETLPWTRPVRGAFPRRNRLISGLSLGVVVIEAGLRSGALITARHATEQGRDVFAVPGPIDSRVSRGCHQLIREGAALIESADDVLEELGPLVQTTIDQRGFAVRRPAELQLNDQERTVLDAIPVQPTPIDRVIAESRLPSHRVLATLSALEIRGLVDRLAGGVIVRR